MSVTQRYFGHASVIWAKHIAWKQHQMQAWAGHCIFDVFDRNKAFKTIWQAIISSRGKGKGPHCDPAFNLEGCLLETFVRLSPLKYGKFWKQTQEVQTFKAFNWCLLHNDMIKSMSEIRYHTKMPVKNQIEEFCISILLCRKVTWNFLWLKKFCFHTAFAVSRHVPVFRKEANQNQIKPIVVFYSVYSSLLDIVLKLY